MGVASLVGVCGLLLALANRPAGDQPDPSPELPLTGELEVRVWTAKNIQRGLIQEPGVVPVVNGEGLQLQAKLNQSAHVYLLWLSSEGEVVPI